MFRRIQRLLSTRALAVVVLAGFVALPVRAGDSIELWAAASLADVLGEIAATWSRTSGIEVRGNYAATSLLARQLAEGGEADIFVSADREWMDYLIERRRVAGQPVDLAGNRLVVIAPPASVASPALAAELPAALDPEHVPAGRYARAAFESLGVWTALADRILPLENVRAVVRVVAGGDAPLGVVYATDVQAGAGLRTLFTLPEDSHPPIVYVAARLQGDDNPAAVELLDHLRGAAAAAVFKRWGFSGVAVPD
jgi:molybdate transport system substrate-binding protein